MLWLSLAVFILVFALTQNFHPITASPQNCTSIIDSDCYNSTVNIPCYCDSLGKNATFGCSKSGDAFFLDKYDKGSGNLICPTKAPGNQESEKSCADQSQIYVMHKDLVDNDTLYNTTNIPCCSTFQHNCIQCRKNPQTNIPCMCESENRTIHLGCSLLGENENRGYLHIYNAQNGSLLCPPKKSRGFNPISRPENGPEKGLAHKLLRDWCADPDLCVTVNFSVIIVSLVVVLILSLVLYFEKRKTKFFRQRPGGSFRRAPSERTTQMVEENEMYGYFNKPL